MGPNALSQAFLFCIFIVNGIIIGILFDIFRVLRRSFKTPDFVTYIEDISFWILAGLCTLYSIFKFNNGEFRVYIFLGILLGTLFYILAFSKYFIKINVWIVTTIKKVISKIIYWILFPIKWSWKLLKKLFFRPFSFIIVNVRAISTNFVKLFTKNVKKTKNKEKNAVQKRDFTI